MAAFTPTGYITLREAVTRCAEVLHPGLDIRKYLEPQPRLQGAQTLLGEATQVHPKWAELFEHADPFCFVSGVGCGNAAPKSSWFDRSGIVVPEFVDAGPSPPEWLAIEAADLKIVQALGNAALIAERLVDGIPTPMAAELWQASGRPNRKEYARLLINKEPALSWATSLLPNGKTARRIPWPMLVLWWPGYVAAHPERPGRALNRAHAQAAFPEFTIIEDDIEQLRQHSITPAAWRKAGRKPRRT